MSDEMICAWCKTPLVPARWGCRHTEPAAAPLGYCRKNYPPRPATIQVGGNRLTETCKVCRALCEPGFDCDNGCTASTGRP